MKIPLVAGLSAALLALNPSASGAATMKFTSCDTMHQAYKYGVALNKKAANDAVKDGMFRPPVKSKVYNASYKTLDRDKDGVMCEVPR